jgi:hypothetical protein
MMHHLANRPSAWAVGCVELLLRKAGDGGAKFLGGSRNLANPRLALLRSG